MLSEASETGHLSRNSILVSGNWIGGIYGIFINGIIS